MKQPSNPGTKSRRIACPEEDAFVDLARTTEILSRPLALLLKADDLSATQYNVLRILRGSPDGLTCGEISSRMITRDSDITRLLDRLENRSLVSRCRENKDRRVVLTRIAPQGLAVLDALDEPVRHAHRELLGHLGAKRLAALSQLLAACRKESD